MSIQPVVQGTFSFFQDLPIIVESTAAQLTSDAGLLPIREFDERIGLTQGFAAVLDDPRDPLHLGHTFSEMTRSRIYGILKQVGKSLFTRDPATRTSGHGHRRCPRLARPTGLSRRP